MWGTIPIDLVLNSRDRAAKIRDILDRVRHNPLVALEIDL
jgi:hypothetical protein